MTDGVNYPDLKLNSLIFPEHINFPDLWQPWEDRAKHFLRIMLAEVTCYLFSKVQKLYENFFLYP